LSFFFQFLVKSDKKKDLQRQKKAEDQANSVMDDLVDQIEIEKAKSQQKTEEIKSKNDEIDKITKKNPELGPISEKIGILEKQIDELKQELDDNKKTDNKNLTATLEQKIKSLNKELAEIKQKNTNPNLGKILSLKNDIKTLIKERNENLGETEFADKDSKRQMTGTRPPVKTSTRNKNIVSPQTNLGQKDKTFSKDVIDALGDAKKLGQRIAKHSNNKSDIQVTGYRLNGDKMNIEGYYTSANGNRIRFDYHVKVNPADKEKIQSTFRDAKNNETTQVGYNNNLMKDPKTK
jgi:chromosome segregation ATPase